MRALPGLTYCAVALVASTSGAAPRTVAVAAGDCSSPELLTGAQSFQEALRTRLKSDLYEPDVVLDLLRPHASRSLEDVQRQLESIRTLFYGGQTARAIELLKPAIVELEQVPQWAKTWPVLADALVFQGNMLRVDNHKAEAVESWKKVLRVDPTYQLDPDLYSGTTVQAFEAVRKEVTHLRKFTLTVTSTPPGAEVFIDGHLLGTTPAKLPLPAGPYRVALQRAPMSSFGRHLTVQKDEQLAVDLAWEGAVSQQSPLCVSLVDLKAQESAALRVAATIGAEKLVLLKLDSNPGDPAFFRASLFDVTAASEIRSGGVRRSPSANTIPLQELAAFVVTGTPSSAVEGGRPAPKTLAVETSVKPAQVEKKPETASVAQPVTPVKAEPMPRPAEPVADPQGTPSGPQAAPPLRGRTGQYVGYSLMGLGGAVAIAGGVNALVGTADRTKLQSFMVDGKLPDSSMANHQTALDLQKQVDASQQNTLILLGTGVGLAVSGLLTCLLFPPDAPVAPAVTLSPSGASVSLAGRF